MKLEAAIESIAIDVAFWIEGIVDPDFPIGELGQVALNVSQRLRALGIVLLVTAGDPNSYLHNLIRSGRAWRTYLRRAQAAGATDDHHYCTGRYQPLLDAIAANEMDLAREIAALSPTAWREGHEYEDDFWFGRILHLLIQPNPDVALASDAVDQYERSLDGEESPRVTLARALLTNNQAEFDEAFEGLLVAREAEIAKNIERGQLEEPVVVAERRVFIEGLAWLRLAEMRGLQTANEYAFCPATARLPLEKPLPEDSDPDMREWLK